MYSWLKYFAFALVVTFLAAFLRETWKHSKEQGGTWKDIIVRIIVWIFIFAVVIAFNIWLNRSWIPGKALFGIMHF